MKQLALTPVRLAALAATLGGAAAAMVWLATYRVSMPPYTGMGPRLAGGFPTTYASPAWTTPVAAVIAIAAVGMAAFVLRRR